MNKKERESKIRELEREIEKLRKEDEPDYFEDEENKEDSESVEKRKYVNVLVLLVILVIVIDLIAFIYYIKPDFDFLKFKSSNVVSNGNTKPVNGKCSDGTKEGACSTNKPYICYNGELLKSAYACGCPEGYKVDFQDCKLIE